LAGREQARKPLSSFHLAIDWENWESLAVLATRLDSTRFRLPVKICRAHGDDCLAFRVEEGDAASVERVGVDTEEEDATDGVCEAEEGGEEEESMEAENVRDAEGRAQENAEMKEKSWTENESESERMLAGNVHGEEALNSEKNAETKDFSKADDNVVAENNKDSK